MMEVALIIWLTGAIWTGGKVWIGTDRRFVDFVAAVWFGVLWPLWALIAVVFVGLWVRRA